MNFFQSFWVKNEFFAAGTGGGDIDSGPDAHFGNFSIEDEFHVTGSFKFLEDKIVHTAAGFDEGGGDDGEATAFFAVAGSGEELSRFFESADIETAGHSAAAFASGGVIGTGKAGEGIEEEDDVFAGFY